MATINRYLLTIRQKQPYVNWANTARGEGPKTSLEESNAEPSAYLVEKLDSDPDGTQALRRHWKAIFDAELEAWCTDVAAWPRNRTLTMFREWFDMAFSSMVVDLVNEPIEHDDD